MLFTDENNFGIFYLRILVKPGSKEQKFTKSDTELRIHLKASPIKGKANKELISFLAEILHLKKSNIDIVKGKKSRDKIVSIAGSSLEHINEFLKLEY